MAAFTDGVDAHVPLREYRRAVAKIGGNNVPSSLRTITLRFAETFGVTVTAGSNNGTAALPRDYQYKDGRPGQKLSAMTLFEDDILAPKKNLTVRESYATWMTSPDNPLFAKVVANRIWKKLMKVGFIEPVDDFNDETKAANEALADYLTRVMVSVKFDLRKYQAIIAATKAYQRQVLTEDEDHMDFHYQGMPLRRLTAEQVWDSLMTLTVAGIDGVRGPSPDAYYKLYEEYKNKSIEQIAEMALNAGRARERLGQIGGELAKIQEQLKNGGDRAKLQGELERLRAEEQKLKANANPAGSGPVRLRGVGDLRRASELPSPMPPGHFLRVFGQSDRNLTDNATDVIDLTQALDLMNGMVESVILGDDKSVLSQELAKATAPSDKVKVIYFAVLSRLPTSYEVGLANRVMSLAPNRRGAEYLSWALINSAEFMFNQ
jgi:hypothetical protein